MTIALHLVALPDSYAQLGLWAERSRDLPPTQMPGRPPVHVHIIEETYLRELLDDVGAGNNEFLPATPTLLWLPSYKGWPLPGYPTTPEWHHALQDSTLAAFYVPMLELTGPALLTFLEGYREQFSRDFHVQAPDLTYWETVHSFATSLVSRQQFVPGMRKPNMVQFEACWQPYPSSEVTSFLEEYSHFMPSSTRAAQSALADQQQPPNPHPKQVLHAVLTTMVDTLVRQTALPARQRTVIPMRSYLGRYKGSTLLAPSSLAQRWRDALHADHSPRIDGAIHHLEKLLERITLWHQKLEAEAARHVHSQRERYRWSFRLYDMIESPDGRLRTSGMTDGPIHWMLQLELQGVSDPSLHISFAQVWDQSAPEMSTLADTETQELLIQLGKVLPIVPALEYGLRKADHALVELTVEEAYTFLTQAALQLRDAGQSVELPGWWREEKQRPHLTASFREPTSSGLFGMNTLLDFTWNVALGDDTISATELAELARSKEALVRFRGRWIQVDHEAIQQALHRLEQRPAGTIPVRDALSMSLQDSPAEDDIIIDSGAWLQGFLAQLSNKTSFAEVRPPTNLQMALRSYQARGYAWLHFLSRFGFGALLADEMGLGKTLTTLTLVGKHWEEQEHRPTLVMTQVTALQQWREEVEKSFPNLPVVVYHGARREEIHAQIDQAAIVLTSYAILQRDSEILREISWRGVVADEAQNIKNATTQQSHAIRILPSQYRIALTGTPIENSILDLWSIFQFLNPGYLGTRAQFLRTFTTSTTSTEKEKEQNATRLKKLVSPFILRRTKSDPDVAPDLPPMIETISRCVLTREQAALYAAVVNELERNLQQATGIRRRGLVLAALTHFKEICVAPSIYLKDGSLLVGNRSGKIQRLEELLEIMLANGKRGLVFTQFATLARSLAPHLAERFNVPVYCLDGQTPEKVRTALRTDFQAGKAPIFVLSLKAGGSAITLTAATEAFFVDRWWNPASEDQAAGRAHRLGQTEAVTAHKMICQGTIEDHIDQLQSGKRILAAGIIPTGEDQLTELDTKTLLDLVRLRAVEGMD